MPAPGGVVAGPRGLQHMQRRRASRRMRAACGTADKRAVGRPGVHRRTHPPWPRHPPCSCSSWTWSSPARRRCCRRWPWRYAPTLVRPAAQQGSGAARWAGGPERQRRRQWGQAAAMAPNCRAAGGRHVGGIAFQCSAGASGGMGSRAAWTQRSWGGLRDRSHAFPPHPERLQAAGAQPKRLSCQASRTAAGLRCSTLEMAGNGLDAMSQAPLPGLCLRRVRAAGCCQSVCWSGQGRLGGALRKLVQLRACSAQGPNCSHMQIGVPA